MRPTLLFKLEQNAMRRKWNWSFFFNLGHIQYSLFVSYAFAN
jgi:hypothetical protein